METMLFLAGAFVAAKIGGLVLLQIVAKNNSYSDQPEFSPAIVVAYLLSAIKSASVLGVLVGLVVFHQELFAIAKTFVGWPA